MGDGVTLESDEKHDKLCAELIRQYWAAKGHVVNVHLEQVKAWGYNGTNRVWGIRSDLKMGMPNGAV